jgi:DNA repair protein RadA/Sms
MCSVILADYEEDDDSEDCVLYIATEEIPGQLKGRADRLHVPNQDRIEVLSTIGNEVDIEESLMVLDPVCVMVDSLPGIVGDDNKEALRLLKTLKEYAGETECPIIVVDHITKEDAFAGRMNIQHEVDTLITFYPDDDESGKRTMKTIKNRFGPAYIQQRYTMTAKGLKIVHEKKPKVSKDTPEDTE